MFVQGPTKDTPPAGWGQDIRGPVAHTWIDIENSGITDLSPNLSCKISGWPGIEFAGITFNEWNLFDRRILTCASKIQFENEINKATNQENEITAIYLESSREPFDAADTRNISRAINSPLTDQVREKYGEDAYITALLHLIDFADSKVKTLTGVSRNKAWQLAVDRYPDPKSRLPR